MNLSAGFTWVIVLREYKFTVTKYDLKFIYGHWGWWHDVFDDVVLVKRSISFAKGPLTKKKRSPTDHTLEKRVSSPTSGSSLTLHAREAQGPTPLRCPAMTLTHGRPATTPLR